MSFDAKNDNFLTLQLHQGHLSPRTFRIPRRWLMIASLSAWILAGVTLFSSVFAIRESMSEKLARPELIKELENEIQELKIALEKRGTLPAVAVSAPGAQGASDGVAPNTTDPKATDEKPLPASGDPWEGKDAVWSGLAENVSLPDPTQEPAIKVEEGKVDWEGKYANFNLNILYKEPGKGSQQGHIVVLGRSSDRIFAHPEGVLNSPSGAHLFDPNRGEYFSVARFRVLKTRLGPFDQKTQLQEVQVFIFDLNTKLILQKSFRYAKQ